MLLRDSFRKMLEREHVYTHSALALFNLIAKIID